jgi:hypothetical protein
MKSLTEHLWFEAPHRRDGLNITGARIVPVRSTLPARKSLKNFSVAHCSVALRAETARAPSIQRLDSSSSPS